MGFRPGDHVRIYGAGHNGTEIVIPEPKLTLEQKFIAFHVANPHVYETLVRLARAAQRAGRTKVGMKMLWEVMRWELFLETADPKKYKLNNSFHSRYSRMIMTNEKDLAGLFETRRLHT